MFNDTGRCLTKHEDNLNMTDISIMESENKEYQKMKKPRNMEIEKLVAFVSKNDDFKWFYFGQENQLSCYCMKITVLYVDKEKL